MQIQRTDNYNNSPGVSPTPAEAAKAATGGPAKKVGAPPDAAVETDLQALARQAAQTSEVNSDAVAQARRLLESNQICTAESIRKAAEVLLRDGI